MESLQPTIAKTVEDYTAHSEIFYNQPPKASIPQALAETIFGLFIEQNKFKQQKLQFE